jgi:hypothetical protein
VDAETRAVDGAPEDAPEERDEFGRRGIALLAGLIVLSVVLAAIDPSDPDLADVLDGASLVAGALFWVALLWLTYGHLRRRRRQA